MFPCQEVALRSLDCRWGAPDGENILGAWNIPLSVEQSNGKEHRWKTGKLWDHPSINGGFVGRTYWEHHHWPRKKSELFALPERRRNIRCWMPWDDLRGEVFQPFPPFRIIFWGYGVAMYKYIYINRVYFPVFIYPVARHDSSSRILSH